MNLFLKYNIFKLCFLGFTLVFVFSSCSVNDAKPSMYQVVHVFTDFHNPNDSLIFSRFEKKTGVKVKLVFLESDSILQRLAEEKYDSKADLVRLSDYSLLKEAKRKNLFFSFKSEILENKIDPNYRSKGNEWIGLSKTPIVLIYNKNILSSDTIKNYYELLYEKWKKKIALADNYDQTYYTFRNTIKFILKIEADSFLIRMEIQTALPKFGTDFNQIDRINKGQAQIAFVRLNNLITSHHKTSSNSIKSTEKVNPVFPNQRKKGCYFTITGIGIYKYARNAQNAKMLVEFLCTRGAQYFYAAGINSYPLVQNVSLSSELKKYRKFRGRFYRY
jgi:iron(III) transport system substrate-binding protein